MTTEEKRKAIKKHCDDTPLCQLCKLCGIGEPLMPCSHSEVSDSEIDRRYEILFGAVTEVVEAPVIDPVNRPAHYTDGKIEVIDYIEDKKLGFCLGNAIKYISRAGKKDPTKEVEDLKKAIWYITRRIKEIEEENHESD